MLMFTGLGSYYNNPCEVGVVMEMAFITSELQTLVIVPGTWGTLSSYGLD